MPQFLMYLNKLHPSVVQEVSSEHIAFIWRFFSVIIRILINYSRSIVPNFVDSLAWIH